MAYFFATALAILIVLVIIATLNMQRLSFTGNGAEDYAEDGELFPPAPEDLNTTDFLQSGDNNPPDNYNRPPSENENNAANSQNLNSQNLSAAGETPIFNANAVYYAGDLELPVNGASGYTSVDIEMTFTDFSASTKLKAGTAFRIIEEDGKWWVIELGDGRTGWVEHITCMINLPDVIPSVIYNNANAYMSKFRASGKDIPNITGKTLYLYEDVTDGLPAIHHNGRAYNVRLQSYEYIVPVLYSMAKRICAAQRDALEHGDTLIIYEGFRPYDVQQLVFREVQRLSNDPEAGAEVKKGLNTYPWSIGWFIASGTSNHQEGYAIDTSLGRVVSSNEMSAGDYKYEKAKDYYEYDMPTEIHDLGMAAATYTSPNSGIYTASMNDSEHAKDLQRYCVNAGLSPLASEWWHFNDENTRRSMPLRGSGKYEIKECLSRPPVK